MWEVEGVLYYQNYNVGCSDAGEDAVVDLVDALV